MKSIRTSRSISIRSRKWFVIPLTTLFLLSAAIAVADISPTSLTATLNLGESVTETKDVTLPAVIPKGDIIFAFDLTGSMGGEIATAKAQAVNIMTNLGALISDPQFAVMSYMDYPHYYSSCGYSADYGWAGSGDYAYSLDHSLSADKTAVAAAINALVLGSGMDGPQDYTRIFYESYADPAIGYRAGSKRILLNFGDNVPHDCNLYEGYSAGTWSTGGDPGRDEIMGTGDDLDLQTVLAGMASNNVTLLEVHSSSYMSGLWDYWTSITGGQNYLLASAGDLPAAIQTLVEGEATYVAHLTLEVTTAGYEGWLTSVVPAAYEDLMLPAAVDFDVVITVPGDATPGIHTFYISAIGDGASYGDQLVTIEVPEPGPSYIPVAVDIKPGSCPNPLNVRGIDGTDEWITLPGDAPMADETMDLKADNGMNHSRAVIPVAILGSDEFDVFEIDWTTVTLAGVPAVRSGYEDVSTPMGEDAEECECNTYGGDGYVDLTLKFDKAAVIAALGSVADRETIPLLLEGLMIDGTEIQGTDCMWILMGGASPTAVVDPNAPVVGDAFPNPFNPTTSFAIQFPTENDYTVTIYNIAGQTVRSLRGHATPGFVRITWDGTNQAGERVASGVYLYRVQAGNYVETRKMLMLK